MNAVEVIRAKRDGHELDPDQIRWFIDAYTQGEVADEQASALLMAVCWRGMSAAELAAWTQAMIDSGDRLDLTGVGRPTVDKHSTGGVGDKVSLVLVPLVASCGAAVPQMAGRGLGHTGGTLDKLEAIPGWRAELTTDELVAGLRAHGAVICAAGGQLAPADRKLYALRDVTGTVESSPLIASSIISKKIAEGTAALVLDVKVGSGAFLPDIAEARELAVTMVELGGTHGVRTSALLTDMDTPLGHAAGNAVEVAEAVETLAGGGPSDLVEVTVALAREMLTAAGVDADPAHKLDSGAAMDTYRAMIRHQGGDPDAPLPRARHVEQLTAPVSGWVRRVDARGVGVAAWRLGAGRARKEDPVDAGAGVVLRVEPGARITHGQVLAELHTNGPERLDDARSAAVAAFEIGDEPPQPRSLILDRVV